MAHQSQLESRKYRNWVKAGLGLKYTKEGLEPFCDQLVKQQHADILNKVQQKHNLSTVQCGLCDIKTLQPDHVRTKSRQCPMGQVNCNCQHPKAKFVCPNSVCGAIYDEIIQLHASTPPAPNWKNTDVQHWCTEPWAIAKCFINAPGYNTKSKAFEFDCSALLHVLLNNLDFLQNHIQCAITGTDIFSKVLQYRNVLFHSHDMELEDNDVTRYIDDMIAVLEDGKELINKKESKAAVQRLRELKGEAFIITTIDETEVRKAAIKALNEKEKELDQKLSDTIDELSAKVDENKSQMERIGSDIKTNLSLDRTEIKNDLKQTGQEVKDDIVQAGVNLKSKMEHDVKTTVADEIAERKNELQQTEQEVKDDLQQAGKHLKNDIERNVQKTVEEETTERKHDLKQFGQDVKDDLHQAGKNLKNEIERNAKNTIADETKERNYELERTGQAIKDDLKQAGMHLRNCIERNVTRTITDEAMERKHELEQTGQEVKDDLLKVGSNLKNDLESNVKKAIADDTIERKHRLKQIGQKVKDDIVEAGMNLKNDIESNVKKIIANETTERIRELEQTAQHTFAGTGLKLKNELDKKVEDAKGTIMEEATRRKYELEQEGKRAEEELEQRIKNFEILQERENEGKNTTVESGLLRPMQNSDEYTNWKAGFKKKLVEGYMKYAIKASALPFRPEKYQREIMDVYEPPLMTAETGEEESRETKEISMHQLLRDQDNKPAKNIYVLGEAGSGKSALCKMLIYYWCRAHSEHVNKTHEPDIVREMLKYEFLFYVALRHYTDCNSVEMMLNEIHHDPNLYVLLQNESGKCLILLDGLDEWTSHTQRPSQFQTPGLPARDLFAGYSVITTSRDWKFDTIRISDSEVDRKIKLKGITGNAVTDLTRKTVKVLNKDFHKNKDADNFELCLENSPVADIKHIPMILQQLIYLWFEDKLQESSKCAVYSSMLDIFFDWKALKAHESDNQDDVESSIRLSYARLPEYLSAYTACCDNENTIYHLSHLAFETLFDRNKESALTFTYSVFQKLNIPHDVKTYALKIGILTEDHSACLFTSSRQPSSFSFVHKSMQEFLAAVYIAIQYESLNIIQKLVGKRKHIVRKCFETCTTVTDILEQANVFIMLSGLEPHLLTYISECIYNISTKDAPMIQEMKLAENYSYTFPFSLLKMNIQMLIGSCINEVLSRWKEPRICVYIADIILINDRTDDVNLFLENQMLRLHSILTVEIYLIDRSNDIMDDVYTALSHLSECNSIKAIKFNVLSRKLTKLYNFSIAKIEEQIMKIVSKNTSTLKSVSFECDTVLIVQLLIQSLPCMHHLTSLHITGVALSIEIPHEDCQTLGVFLEQTSHLQQIHLNVECYVCRKHLIDLTKHKRLQYLSVHSRSFSVTRFNADKLETCRISSSTGDIDIFAQVCNCLEKAYKLKHLHLNGHYIRLAETGTVTERFTRLLPSLTSLNTVTICQFTINDNIITSPFDMKNLKKIELFFVAMTISTWRKFIDSLPALPQSVQVEIRDLMPNGRYMYYNDIRDMYGENAVAARQYVKEKTEFFRVTKDVRKKFIFATIKANT